MNELSKLIKRASDLNSPSSDYFNNFLSSYKTYHKRQNVKRAVYKICTAFAIVVILCLSTLSILDRLHRQTLDIQTASGMENESK